MTWAKAIPTWRPDPQAALDTLIALNHRYALDGSDPNSYGGLLWSLGLFDRLFDETPVMGRVRTRSTAAHARRLDIDRYRARVSRPASGDALRIAGRFAARMMSISAFSTSLSCRRRHRRPPTCWPVSLRGLPLRPRGLRMPRPGR